MRGDSQSLFSPESDKECIADFFAHVVFSGCRDFQRDSDCERYIEIGVKSSSRGIPTLNADRKRCAVVIDRGADTAVHEAAGPDGASL